MPMFHQERARTRLELLLDESELALAEPETATVLIGAGVGVREEHLGRRLLDDGAADRAVKECLDELEEILATIKRFSPTVLAIALRVHLEGLLEALLEGKVCT